MYYATIACQKPREDVFNVRIETGWNHYGWNELFKRTDWTKWV